VAGGLLAGTGLQARRLAPPAPRRRIALVARRSTARRAAFDQLADAIAAGAAAGAKLG
jgi:LysR family hydrogen peroxide-inducible transcriptional activator